MKRPVDSPATAPRIEHVNGGFRSTVHRTPTRARFPLKIPRPILLLALLCGVLHAAEPRQIKVLWLGNSYTGLRVDKGGTNIAALTERFIEERPGDVAIAENKAVIRWGRPLRYHWEYIPEKEPTSLDLVRGGSFTHVVLQGYCNDASVEFPQMIEENAEYVAKFVAEIRRAGATPILYGHHASGSASPAKWDAVNDHHAATARTLGVTLAPAGATWRKVMAERPDIDLYNTESNNDRGHQGRYGTYLNACIFCALLTGQNPEGLSTQLGISQADAAYLQKMAWEAVRDQVQKGKR